MRKQFGKASHIEPEKHRAFFWKIDYERFLSLELDKMEQNQWSKEKKRIEKQRSDYSDRSFRSWNGRVNAGFGHLPYNGALSIQFLIHCSDRLSTFKRYPIRKTYIINVNKWHFVRFLALFLSSIFNRPLSNTIFGNIENASLSVEKIFSTRYSIAFVLILRTKKNGLFVFVYVNKSNTLEQKHSYRVSRTI